MNDIEILELYVNTDNKYAGSIEIEIKEAIKSVLKERQADKDRINILRDRVQENERTLKDLTNTFAKEKQKYENDIDILLNRIDEYEINTVWKYTVKEDYIPKSLVKEKMEWLEDNILNNEYASGSDMDIAEYQIDILKRILGEKQ